MPDLQANLVELPWPIRIEVFICMAVDEWISLVLDVNKTLPIPAVDKSKFQQFFITSFELIWMERNKIWNGGKKTNWEEISSRANKT